MASSMLETILTQPPQLTQVSISIPNTRLSRCAQWAGCPGAAERRDARERPTKGDQAFEIAMVAAHPQKTMFQNPAAKEVIELAAHLA